jgi:hypothetical protein
MGSIGANRIKINRFCNKTVRGAYCACRATVIMRGKIGITTHVLI